MKLTGLTIDQLAQVLTAAGSDAVTAEQVEARLAEGAPRNPDGTINLVTYTAWLVLRLHGKRPPQTPAE